MRKLLIILVSLAALATPAVASASPWHRGCGYNSQGGIWLNHRAIAQAPWLVNMPEGVAIRIANRLPDQEFHTRIKPQAIPCLVAGAIVSYAGDAWLKWPGDSGSADVELNIYDSGREGNLGRFYCNGYRPLPRNEFARETCHQGRTGVSFTIAANPHS